MQQRISRLSCSTLVTGSGEKFRLLAVGRNFLVVGAIERLREILSRCEQQVSRRIDVFSHRKRAQGAEVKWAQWS